jgi:uncharacterized protein
MVAPADLSIDRSIDEILEVRLGVDRTSIGQLCQQFGIVELGLFGSALRDDFRRDGDNPSDVDVLVVFGEGDRLSWQDWLRLESAIEVLFGRNVDLCQKRLLKNPYSRAEILRNYRVIYEF